MLQPVTVMTNQKLREFFHHPCMNSELLLLDVVYFSCLLNHCP
uniref:Uncharacterized protein n=1 Tax=Arundo donax TaxID=35708 RepID=A0A0A9HQS5_ARUDO